MKKDRKIDRCFSIETVYMIIQCTNNGLFDSVEKDFITECRKNWWKDKNCTQMLKVLPRKYNIERALLEGLIKFGENNYANAFQMVCHSF